MMENKKRFRITKEDKQIIELKAQGLLDNEIAEEIGISPYCYRYRYNRLLLKIGALNAPNLIYQAFKQGILRI